MRDKRITQVEAYVMFDTVEGFFLARRVGGALLNFLSRNLEMRDPTKDFWKLVSAEKKIL